MMSVQMKRTKDERIEIRAEPKDVKKWRAAADVLGMSLSDWMRRVCNSVVAADVTSGSPEVRQELIERAISAYMRTDVRPNGERVAIGQFAASTIEKVAGVYFVVLFDRDAEVARYRVGANQSLRRDDSGEGES